MRNDYKKLFTDFGKNLRKISIQDNQEPKDCEYIFYARDKHNLNTYYNSRFGDDMHESLAQMLESIIVKELYFYYIDDIKQGKYPKKSEIYQFYAYIMDEMDILNIKRFENYDPEVFWKDWLKND